MGQGHLPRQFSLHIPQSVSGTFAREQRGSANSGGSSQRHLEEETGTTRDCIGLSQEACNPSGQVRALPRREHISLRAFRRDPLSLKILRPSRRKLRKSEWRCPTLGEENRAREAFTGRDAVVSGSTLAHSWKGVWPHHSKHLPLARPQGRDKSPADRSQPRAAALSACPRKQLGKRHLCLHLPPSRGC